MTDRALAAPDVTLRFLAGALRMDGREDDARACEAGADALLELAEYYTVLHAQRPPPAPLDLFGDIPDVPVRALEAWAS